MSNEKTATERLREMLDAQGVEYEESTQGNTTFFQFDYCEQCGGYMKSIVITGECMSAYSDYLTPEQAIAATLGSGTLTAEQVCDVVEKHWHDLPDEYDMPEATALPEYSYDWHAIADELNATLGSGECEMTEAEIEDRCGEHYVYLTGWTCSECGHASTSLYSDEIPKFCPNCGAKVKAVKR